jgi:hypothetical protein
MCISGVKQYHFSPEISTAYDVRVVSVSVPASTLQNVTDQIPTKVTEALTTYTSPTTPEMIALILEHVQAAMTTFTSPTKDDVEQIVGDVIDDKNLPDANTVLHHLLLDS